MPERGVTAQPGMVPGVHRTAGTMFAALYGELVPHPWRAPAPDADGLFYHRSLAMGWLDDRSTGLPGSAPGLWAMNDAGWRHPRGDETGLVAWFQVEASAVAHDRPLPVQPFLRCAYDVMVRVGALHLSAVQVLLPVQGINPLMRPPFAPMPSMRTTAWYFGGDPQARTPVEVRINSGQDPSVSTFGRQLTDQLAGLDQDVFAHSYRDVVDSAVASPPLDDSFWNGPALHGVTLHGDLVEWSCEAVGWLAEAVADAGARLGVRSPLLLTVTRSALTH